MLATGIVAENPKVLREQVIVVRWALGFAVKGILVDPREPMLEQRVFSTSHPISSHKAQKQWEVEEGLYVVM